MLSGMAVAPEIQRLLDLIETMQVPPLSTLTPDAARALMAAMPSSAEPADVASVADRAVPGPEGAPDVPVRIYRPAGDGPFGALLWIHGGGWVLGSLDQSDGTCRELCAHAGVVVVSVDYRLAPEDRFPAAPLDCIAALRWLVAEATSIDVDPGRLAVGGDSAGGNLAAVVAVAARDHDIAELRHQLLVYPAVDFALNRPSNVENAEGYLLTAVDLGWMIDQYLPVEQRTDPLAAPLCTPELAGVAPALVITARYDPLRDEGADYAARLAAEGVAVDHVCYDDMIHGFFGMTSMVQSARDARDRATSALRAALG